MVKLRSVAPVMGVRFSLTAHFKNPMIILLDFYGIIDKKELNKF